jgi:hypothetical protein
VDFISDERQVTTRAHPFLCECGDPRCRERLILTPAAYLATTQPALAPGHRLLPPTRPGLRGGRDA